MSSDDVTHAKVVQRLADEMFKAAVWVALGTFAAGVVVSTIIWGTGGLYGALIGGAIACASAVATLVLMRKTADLDPMFVMVAALGGFTGKLIVLFAALLLLRGQEWLEPKALGITMVVTVLVTAYMEARASKRTRSQMVVPASDGT
jgi:ATP synthase protein I